MLGHMGGGAIPSKGEFSTCQVELERCLSRLEGPVAEVIVSDAVLIAAAGEAGNAYAEVLLVTLVGAVEEVGAASKKPAAAEFIAASPLRATPVRWRIHLPGCLRLVLLLPMMHTSS